jgi:catechol 2,3-dioxygenase-like lactoylglutathione lyase family enzyme
MMQLVQSRIVTEDVGGLAGFYARLVGACVVLNDYYVEVPAGGMSVGFSKPRFTEYGEPPPPRAGEAPAARSSIVLDFLAESVDEEFERIDALGVAWVLLPATQPWGSRSMVFRDPEGNLVNVFSRPGAKRGRKS